MEGELKKEVKKNGDSKEMVVIEIKDYEINSEKVCRICQESFPPIIALGCDCKGGLGFSHHSCAATWFAFKGDRVCEICGTPAKNIRRSSRVVRESRREVRVEVEVEEEDGRVGECCGSIVCFVLICLYLPLLFYYTI